MLLQSHLTPAPAIDRLVRAWTLLYYPNFKTLPLTTQPELYSELSAANSAEGRALTYQKLNEALLHLYTEAAGVQTSELYAYMETVMNLREIRQVAGASFRVYQKLIALYAEDALGLAEWNPLSEAIETGAEQSGQSAAVLTLAEALEPLLLEFQELHQRSQDWRSLGFLTTQFNFSNACLLRSLTDCERVLIEPYLRFVEEQIAHPWERVCAAAIEHAPNSPIVTTVEKIMRQSNSVACSTYSLLVQRCTRHRSRRGPLTNPSIQHSCLRDLKMFQSYLCLCMMEGSMQSVEQELLDLCVRVLPSVGVKWELTATWTETLAHELLSRLEPEQKQLALPYATRMHQIFLNARSQFDTALARSI